MALLAVSQFILGCVMEEQARDGNATPPSAATMDSEHLKGAQPLAIDMAQILTANAEETFEFGLSLILAGLRSRIRDAGDLALRRITTKTGRRGEVGS